MSVSSVSLASVCEIRNESDNTFVLRNRSTFERTGQIVFGPVGGGIAVPLGILQKALDELGEFSPSLERKTTDDGLTDLRFELDSPAMTDEQKSRLLKAAWNIIDLVPPEYISPIREIREELVVEEHILGPEDLEGASIQRSARFAGAQLLPNHRDPSLGRRLYVSTTSIVALSPVAMLKLGKCAETSPELVRFIAPKDIKRGMSSGLLVPGMRALAPER